VRRRIGTRQRTLMDRNLVCTLDIGAQAADNVSKLGTTEMDLKWGQ
jgi:hypothetical protein